MWNEYAEQRHERIRELTRDDRMMIDFDRVGIERVAYEDENRAFVNGRTFPRGTYSVGLEKHLQVTNNRGQRR